MELSLKSKKNNILNMMMLTVLNELA